MNPHRGILGLAAAIVTAWVVQTEAQGVLDLEEPGPSAGEAVEGLLLMPGLSEMAVPYRADEIGISLPSTPDQIVDPHGEPIGGAGLELGTNLAPLPTFAGGIAETASPQQVGVDTCEVPATKPETASSMEVPAEPHGDGSARAIPKWTLMIALGLLGTALAAIGWLGRRR